jgi:predicted RNA-binding Zn ribbon-like protein
MLMTPSAKTSSPVHSHKFELVAGQLCLDFCNTINFAISEPNERVNTFGDLVLWGKMAGLLTTKQANDLSKWAESHRNAANAAVRQARKFRAAIHRSFVDIAHGTGPAKDDLVVLNETLSAARSNQHLFYHQSSFQLDWNEVTGLNQVLWPVAVSAAELLTGPDLKFVRQCSGSSCSWLFMDFTRNHSRRWCTMEVCGNRAKAKRYYERNQK